MKRSIVCNICGHVGAKLCVHFHVLKSYEIIQPGFVAYHVSGNRIDDVMNVECNLGGYKDKPVSELVRDGWTFVCRSEKYKIGDEVKWYV